MKTHPIISKLVKCLKMKSVMLMICLSFTIFAVGCAEIQGKYIKTYHSEYRAAVQASSDALANLEIPVVEEVSDELRTEFLARRPDGTPVTVEVTRVDQNFTQVSVSTGTGVARLMDKNVSHQIHGFIRGRLSKTVIED